MPTSLKLTLGTLASPQSGGPGRQYHARLVRAGQVRASDNTPADIVVEPDALASAVAQGLFDNRAVFVDHAGWLDYPSLDRLVGVTRDAAWNEADQSVEGVLHLYDTPGAQVMSTLLDQILADPAHAPDVGLSMVFYPVWESHPSPPGRGAGGEGEYIRTITGITHVESVDLVFQPAADGRVLQALSTHYVTTGRGAPACAPATQSAHSTKRVISHPHSKENQPMPEELSTTPTIPTPAPEISIQNLQSKIENVQVVQTILRSGLPAPAQERLAAQVFPDLPSLIVAIDSERAYLAALHEPTVVQLAGSAPRGGRISGLLDSLDRITLAAEALLMGQHPAGGIQPLTGIRELYHLLSGDYEMTGMFQSERVQFANVTSSTMAGIVANALNKTVINEFQQYPKWWEPIVQQMDFATLQAVKWITLGGVGELPTVAEGAAYTELTWDDNTETASFVKKGGYLGITLETIDKDDTGRVSIAPRALAQAAWLTLSKSISAIFTQASGTGPTMADGQVLFYNRTAGNNVASGALTMATWNTARLTMRKFTELNSGERLGALTAPKYLLVPPDLEITATQILASESDYTYALSNGTGPGPANVHAEGDTFNARMNMARKRVVVVDLWTDTNDWAAVADPRLYPTIGLGFRYGRQPEIFSVASPTAGLMFSNDTMPVKVRYFYATGPMDWRGMYKANVT